MAKSKEHKLLDAWLEKRDPYEAATIKHARHHSINAQAVRKAIKQAPTAVMLKELYKRAKAEQDRKEKTRKQRERREELRRKKELHSSAK